MSVEFSNEAHIDDERKRRYRLGGATCAAATVLVGIGSYVIDTTPERRCASPSLEAVAAIDKVGTRSLKDEVEATKESTDDVIRDTASRIGITFPDIDRKTDPRMMQTADGMVRSLSESFQGYDINTRASKQGEKIDGYKIQPLNSTEKLTHNEIEMMQIRSIGLLFALHRMPKELIKELDVKEVVVGNDLINPKTGDSRQAFSDPTRVAFSLKSELDSEEAIFVSSIQDFAGEMGRRIDTATCGSEQASLNDDEMKSILGSNNGRYEYDISELKAQEVYASLLTSFYVEGPYAVNQEAEQLALERIASLNTEVGEFYALSANDRRRSTKQNEQISYDRKNISSDKI